MSVFPSLVIGDLVIDPPIIQGGMGVRVSLSNLASAVANEGGAGIIATAGIGDFLNHPGSRFVAVNEAALRHEIRTARSQTNGVIGINAMVALSNFENLAITATEEGIDLIISGAGLPLHLPKYVQGTNVKLIPIVSSGRAFKIICTKWQRQYNRLPDAVVVEGVKAGGHLGFSYPDVIQGATSSLDQIVQEVLPLADSFSPRIPVVAAGGIFDGNDIAHYLDLGASGVQMSSRFVCTAECDVHDNFKQAYLDAKEDDIVVINSPVGLPGRVIKNDFVERILRGQSVPYKCKYQCLKSCNYDEAPYCIAELLANAANGKLENAFAFAGSNVHRCKEIIPVKSLMEKITREYEDATGRKRTISTGDISIEPAPAKPQEKITNSPR